jgi:hypothetical protein
MNRFGHEFETSLEEVALSTARLVQLSQAGRRVVFRYEDNFVSRRATVARLSTKLGLELPHPAIERIFNSLSPESVKRKIAALEKKGAFGIKPDPDRFDAKTHWHPRHIGDRRIGKYTDVLSLKMQRRVLCATADYCARFGYPADLP